MVEGRRDLESGDCARERGEFVLKKDPVQFAETGPLFGLQKPSFPEGEVPGIAYNDVV
jgi:hypothetical protein